MPSNFGSSATTHNPAFALGGTAAGDPPLASAGGEPAPAVADPSRGGLFDLDRAYEFETPRAQRGIGSATQEREQHYSTPGTDVNPAYDVVQEPNGPGVGGGGGGGAVRGVHTAPGYESVLTQRGSGGGQAHPAYASVLTRGDEGRGGAGGAYDSVLTQQANVAYTVPYDSVLTSATPPSAAQAQARAGPGQARLARPTSTATGPGTGTTGDPRYTHISAAEIARATRAGNTGVGATAGGNGRSGRPTAGELRAAQAPARTGCPEPRPDVDDVGYVAGEGAAMRGVPTYAVPTAQALGAGGVDYEGVEELRGGGGSRAGRGRSDSVRSLQGFGLEAETST